MKPTATQWGPYALIGVLTLVLVLLTAYVFTIQDRVIKNQTQVCRATNYEHEIISDALVASLTEADVQANAVQRIAYQEIVDKFAKPEPCGIDTGVPTP